MHRRPGSTVSFDDHARAPSVRQPTVVIVPYVYQEYPRWLYCHGQPPRIVQTDQERRALSGDWAETPAQAEAIHERQEQLIANAAAERAFADRRLSAKARAEKLAQERATDAHVPE